MEKINHQNCKHYNEVVENPGCECKPEGDSVCELWVSLVFSHDFASQLGIKHAKQTIANLDTRVEEIAQGLLSKVNNNNPLGTMIESSQQNECQIKY
ncbi:hypothetical protein [Flavobacterium gawalongense]|uniref:Uncharacterized protein n=1 Tax=Flavobacterium gawalongense TaxID=2594432 RepID=A0ABY3CL72_9FLAO|nr:hypothetical protein [Flavobacterium gawalongense]TRX02028.1 hypothetical protein FNW33_07615 [Flavobacterium gawalongense]TRX06556.1 hypothetical protein FNW12_08150 [Flavobacterium gawalongense]